MRYVLGLLVFAAVTVLAWIVIVVGYGTISGAMNYNDFEGSTAMGVAFGIAPLVALIAGFTAMIWFVMRR